MSGLETFMPVTRSCDGTVMPRGLRWTVLSIALLLSALSAPTAAQTMPDIPQVISPIKIAEDPNGVNVANGRASVSLPSISVPAAPNLRFDRVSNAAPYLSGRLSQTSPGQGDQRTYSVHTGAGSSSSFRCIDFDCEDVTGSGSTLVPNSRLFRQAGSGVKYAFTSLSVAPVGGQLGLLYYATSVEYPNGEIITYDYDTSTISGLTQIFHRPNRMTSNLGYFITITYHSADINSDNWLRANVVTLYASSAPTVALDRLTYSADGTTVTDFAGRVFTCTGCTNQLGQNVEVTQGTLQLPTEATNTLTITPAASGQPLVSSITRDGVSWTYNYSNVTNDPKAASPLYTALTVTGPNGYNVVYNMSNIDRRNEITSIVDPLRRSTSYTLDGSGRPVTATMPEGNLVLVTYDDYGNIISRTQRAKPGSGLADITETAFVPVTTCTGTLCYRPTWTRDALGRQTDYSYTARGLLLESLAPADAAGIRQRTIIEYEPGPLYRRTAVRLTGIAANGGTVPELRTEYQYWGGTFLPSLERRIDVATGVTLETAYTYDPVGRPLVIDGPLPGTSDARYFRYDINGRKTWEIDALGANGLRNARRFTYRDSDDKVIATETGTVLDPSSTVLTVVTRSDVAYDSRRNAVREAASAGGTTYAVTNRSFDDRGQIECETVRMNPAAFVSTPPSACTLGTTGTQGADRITRNTYDAAGQLLLVQRAYGTPRQQNYVTYTYTLNGQRSSVRDANGNLASMTYDGFDRQTHWNFPSPTTVGVVSTTDYEQYGYDVMGDRTSLRRRDGTTITYQYDAMRRPLVMTVPASVTGAAAYSVYYGYTVFGAQRFARFGSTAGAGITNTYDAHSRLLSSANNMSGTSLTLAYQYDTGSRRSRLTWPDGNYVTYDYSGAGELAAIRENGTTVVASFGYDAAGRPQSRTTTGASETMGYDALSRLASLTLDLSGTGADHALGFSYNPASQIVQRTASNDGYAPNTYLTVSRTYMTNGLNQYTAAGPATFTYDANGNLRTDGTSTYTYDGQNHLTAATGAQTAVLAYDPLGRLWQTSGGIAGVTRFLYNGDELVAEYSDTGTLLRRYVHGLGSDDPVLWYEGAGLTNRRTLMTDHQGSIIAVTDSAGAALAINAYDAWGIPNSSNLGRFQYTGQIWLPELGMYHYKARIYSPTLGRFLQTDPIGYQDQVNLYAYVRNDPVDGRDPTGMCTGSRIEGACSGGRTFTGAGGCSGTCFGGTLPAPLARQASVDQGRGLQNSDDIVAVGQFNGLQTYGNNPRLGRPVQPWYPNGRINTDLPGGHARAWRDLDRIAQLNFITPPSNIGPSQAAASGWVPSYNTRSGYAILTHVSGLEIRFNGANLDTRITIPVGLFIAPNIPSTYLPETIHYRGW